MKHATTWCALKSKGPVYMSGKRGEKTFTKNAIDKFQVGKIRRVTKE